MSVNRDSSANDLSTEEDIFFTNLHSISNSNLYKEDCVDEESSKDGEEISDGGQVGVNSSRRPHVAAFKEVMQLFGGRGDEVGKLHC